MSRDQSRTRIGRYLTTLLGLSTALLMLPVVAMAEESVESVEASAYGVYANVDVNGIGATLGPSPSSSVPGSGGNDTDSAANLDLAIDLLVATLDVVDTGVLNVSSNGSQVGTPDGSATSEASVTDVNLIAASTLLLPNLLPAVVHADTVTASCEADVDGLSGSTRLVGASVSGFGALAVNPAPNTKVTIADVGTLWLNRQTTDSSGNLTVTGLQLVLNLDLDLSLGLLETLDIEGDGIINIARAVCGVDTEQITTTTTTSPTTTSTSGGATTNTSNPDTTTSTEASNTTTTTGATTTTAGDEDATTTTFAETTTTLDDFCPAEEENDDELAALASNTSGTGFGALRIGGSASVGDGGTVPVVLNILILLVAAALGAVGGYAIHKFGLFERMARVKGAGL